MAVEQFSDFERLSDIPWKGKVCLFVKKMINVLFLIVGILCIVYYFACGFAVRFNQSILWIWLVIGAVLIGRFALVRLTEVRGALPYPRWFLTTVRCAFCAGLAFFLFVEGVIATGFFYKCPENVDYLMILGAKTGSVTLERRIDKAADYLLANPETIAVATGGKGGDENVTEAAFIREGLIRRGVPEERILVEEQSVSTLQNMAFSRQIIPQDAKSVAFVSNDYHMFRSKSLAKGVFDCELYGLPMRSAKLSLPHYMVREFCAILVETAHGNMNY